MDTSIGKHNGGSSVGENREVAAQIVGALSVFDDGYMPNAVPPEMDAAVRGLRERCEELCASGADASDAIRLAKEEFVERALEAPRQSAPGARTERPRNAVGWMLAGCIGIAAMILADVYPSVAGRLALQARHGQVEAYAREINDDIAAYGNCSQHRAPDLGELTAAGRACMVTAAPRVKTMMGALAFSVAGQELLARNPADKEVAAAMAAGIEAGWNEGHRDLMDAINAIRRADEASVVMRAARISVKGNANEHLRAALRESELRLAAPNTAQQQDARNVKWVVGHTEVVR